MSINEAIRILDPETTAEALAEYDRPHEAVEDACILACEVMKDYDDLEDENERLRAENELLRKLG